MGEPKRRGGAPRNPLQGRTSQRAKQSPLPAAKRGDQGASSPGSEGRSRR
jgi:hypothetical protein